MSNVEFNENDFEELLLATCLKDLEFTKNLDCLQTKSNQGNSNFADPKNQIIFNLVSRFEHKYNRCPKLDELKILVEKLSVDDEIKILLFSQIANDIRKSEEDFNIDFIKDETKKFVQKVQYAQAMQLAIADYENSKFDSITERFKNVVDIFEVDNKTEVSNSSIVKLSEELLDKDLNTKRISSGFQIFDKTIDGGFLGSNMYVFCGTSGSGKSILLLEFALQAVKQNKNVLYISLEMDNRAMLFRLLINLLPNFNSLDNLKMNYKLNKVEILNQIEQIKDTINGKLDLFYSDSIGNCSKDISKKLEKKHYDMVVVDYLGLMDTNNSNISEENPHFKYKKVCEELRQLAKVYDIPMLTADQLNSDSYKKNGTLSLSNLAYSNAIGYTSDFVSAINFEGNQLVILKNRSGALKTFDIYINKPKFKVESMFEARNVSPQDDKKIDELQKEKQL